MDEIAEIEQWHNRAQIDYKHHYMGLYASFNAWYRLKTGSQNDREALNTLRAGNSTWDEYCDGKTMRDLTQYMELLAECTQREPISYISPHWQGEVAHSRDWASVIEYWYRVRCLVMHGVGIRSVYVYLAYETLNIFMTEVISRKQY